MVFYNEHIPDTPDLQTYTGLRGDQYQVVQKCSSMSYISLTPQKKIFDFLPEEVT